ncbi:MAG: SusD/RagB family nutrient-binding outer membrane lipoprotein [Cyclobacteriaceae bacterium]
MKKYINVKIWIVTFVLTGAISSCDFGDANINPATPETVAMSALLPNAEVALSWAIGGEFVRMSGLLTQQFEGINAQQQDNYQYLIREADTDGVWQRTYFNTLSSANQIIKQAIEADAPHYEGVAQVMMAYGISILTDAFGDVPYTDAFGAIDGNFAPEYDTQQELYETILPALLTDAVNNLSAATSLGGSPGTDDLIFGGNLNNWITAANSLRVRMALQAAKQNGNASYTDALAGMASAIAGNGGDFEMTFGGAGNEVNPQFQFSQDRAGNIRMDANFAARFIASDSRQPAFINDDYELGANNAGYYSVSASPVVLMSYTELKFIEAEAELMQTASDVAASKAALDAAVNASFEKITGASTPVAYQADLDARWTAAATNADRLSVLIDEKFIGCYGQSIVAWNDYRRTGYPVLTANPLGTNAFNANGQIPRRLPYPQEERLLNLSNLPIATPNLQTRFWWDQ